MGKLGGISGKQAIKVFEKAGWQNPGAGWKPRRAGQGWRQGQSIHSSAQGTVHRHAPQTHPDCGTHCG